MTGVIESIAATLASFTDEQLEEAALLIAIERIGRTRVVCSLPDSISEYRQSHGDARSFGMGFLSVLPDGHLVRLDPRRIRIEAL